MDQTALVGIDITLGEETLNALEIAGIKVNVALWAWLRDHEDRRFVLASRQLDSEKPRQGYELVHAALN
jgi:hypothetical protein